jgi:glutathione S-transferase
MGYRTMGLILYDNPASSNAMKVRFLLAELALNYERRHIPLVKPRPPAFFPAERVGLMHVDIEAGGGDPEDADPVELEDAIAQAVPRLDLLEWLTADNGTMVGTFTIAGCAVAPGLWRWYRLPLGFDGWPKVSVLRETVASRPAVQDIGLVG